MELAFVIYLIDNLCSMKGSFWDLGTAIQFLFVPAMITGFCWFVYAMEGGGDKDGQSYAVASTATKYLKLWFFWTTPVFILGSVLNTVIPSKDTAYKMLAAYGVQETVVAAQQSEYVQKMTGKSLQLLEKTVDKYLEESDNTSQETKETSSKKQSKENK